MIEVIGKDSIYMYRISCSNCASVLQYTKSDIKKVMVFNYTGAKEIVSIINCPICGKEIRV